jgi:hypothetical protein
VPPIDGDVLDRQDDRGDFLGGYLLQSQRKAIAASEFDVHNESPKGS